MTVNGIFLANVVYITNISICFYRFGCQVICLFRRLLAGDIFDILFVIVGEGKGCWFLWQLKLAYEKNILIPVILPSFYCFFPGPGAIRDAF